MLHPCSLRAVGTISGSERQDSKNRLAHSDRTARPQNPGGRKPELTNIDDGYWQGAPVGGFGAGTFSRSYRGNFERWHIKAGVHKYQNVPANQFAVFEQAEGESPMAEVLSTGKPEGGALCGVELVLSCGVVASTRRFIPSRGSLTSRHNFR